MQVENRNNSLSNIQLELLKLYSTDIKEEELLEIKSYIADFFSKKAVQEADKLWDENSLTNEDMDRWLNEQKANNE